MVNGQVNEGKLTLSRTLATITTLPFEFITNTNRSFH